MVHPLIIASLAGVVSAILFASATTGIVLAVPLLYIAPLPVFLTGFGLGRQAVLVCGAAGSLALLVFTGGVVMMSYFLTLALPAGILIYLALLARESSSSAPLSSGETSDATLEWYPPGNLIAWAAVMAGTLTALAIPFLGFDAESYQAAVQGILEKTVLKDLEDQFPQQLDPDQALALTAFLVRALPAVSAVVWFLAIVLNMWAAGRVIDFAGHGLRPWPKIEAMSYPQEFSIGFVVSLVLSMMGGLMGIIATGFTGAFIMAFVLLGLAVIHSLSRLTHRLRPVILSMLYMAILLFGWIVLIIASIGIGEPIFKLRDRFSKHTEKAGRDDD